MEEIHLGQIWEMYSSGEGRWVRVIVTKIDGGEVTLRYEGLLEFMTVDLPEMQNNPEAFRRATSD